VSLLDTALALHASGLAPLPLRTDGSKAPAVSWADYTNTPPDLAQVTNWFTTIDTDGIGTLCGHTSGDLEMLEVEGRATPLIAQLGTLMADHGYADLWNTIITGWVELSPSGGIHWHYRISDGPARPNTKLASRPSTPEELVAKPAETRKVLIETRGQGGFTILAPSAGRSHLTGHAWMPATGTPDTCPLITVDQRDALYAIAAMLDQMPVIDAPTQPKSRDYKQDGSLRPGDDYNQRAQWADILTGWTRRDRPFAANCYGWSRPGKTIREGISATTGRNDADNIYVFSSSTEFETETPYSKFGAYTLLEHHGDYSAAAKALAGQGYGTQIMREQDMPGATFGIIAPPTAIPEQAPSGHHDEPTTIPEQTETVGIRHIVLTSAADIKPRPVFWLWKNRLALGTLGLLAGREGTGKSTLSYWITARLTRGDLYGIYQGTPKAVLVCATEDSWEHTIVPRLIAAGADLHKVFRVEVVNADDIHVGLSLPRDLLAVESAAEQTGAALLLLDPLMSRLGDLDTHRDAEVRQALEPLVAIADRTNMAILGLIHHNKSGSSDPLQLVMGSKAFTAVARSVHTVIPDPDDDTNQRRLFGTPKNNLGRSDLPTFTFTIVGHPIHTDEGTAWTGCLEWGEELEGSIDDAMERAAGGNEERGATGEAADWLSDYVASKGGQVASSDAKKAGRAAGHAERTVKRAASKLRLIVTNSGFPRMTYWELPSEIMSTAPSSSGAKTGLTPSELAQLAPLEPRGEVSLSLLSLSEHENANGSPVGPVGPVGPREMDYARAGLTVTTPPNTTPCYVCHHQAPMPGRGICHPCAQANP